MTSDSALEFEDTAPSQIEDSVVTDQTISDDDTAVLGSGNVIDNTVAELPAPAESADRVSEAQPGDVFVGNEIPADASIEGQESLAPIPVVETAQSSTESGSGAWTWLIWLAGTGVAIIGGLLLFGRRLRDRFGGDSAPDADPALSRRASDNADTQTNETIAAVDFGFDDAGFDAAVMSQQTFQLDADLGAGTGLQEGSDMDVAQDFGFSATDEHAALDMEFSASDMQDEEQPETDIIPPQKDARETILDSEVPPDSDDDGEYDLSMIVDATKQAPGDAEGTTKDLNAVQLPAQPETDGTNYTLSKEVDYHILEQDYEDEMTQTQALNQDIEKAAMELVARMGEDTDSETADVPALESDVTAEMPVASADNEPTAEMPIALSEDEITSALPSSKDADMTAELTAELPTDAVAENEDFISDLDDTGVNEELTANMNLSGDETVEMEVEGGTVDTKKIAG